MTRGLTIVGLGGSMAKVSRSRAALVAALEGATGAGAEKFASERSLHRQTECDRAAERAAEVA